MIRFAEYNDIPRIMQFIDKQWKKDHILSKDRKLFEFQHLWGEEVSFVLEETPQGELNGILGYIPYDSDNRDVTLAIWKVLKTEDAMLGVKILRFLQEDSKVKNLSAPGINPKTKRIYQFLGIQTGKMRHWYRLRQADSYKIALVNDVGIPPISLEQQISIKEYNSFEAVKSEFGLEYCLRGENRPYKSLHYIKRRYFQHPMYQYLKFGIHGGGKRLLLLFRVQQCNGSHALRLIDAIGDLELFPCASKSIDRLMGQFCCEYVDIYETGLEQHLLRAGGWKLTDETTNIIPEYFSPFEQRNIDIYYMSTIPNAVLFKGDGDMDRPN